MDGETYECVKSFCYLGDILDGDCGADLAATARIRNGWMKLKAEDRLEDQEGHRPEPNTYTCHTLYLHLSLTTPISSTSPVLDKTSEPRVPPIHAPTVTTSPPDPTPALPSPSHMIHTCNTNNSTCITVTATTAFTT